MADYVCMTISWFNYDIRIWWNQMRDQRLHKSLTEKSPKIPHKPCSRRKGVRLAQAGGDAVMWYSCVIQSLFWGSACPVRLDAGTFGTMGVGLGFAIAAATLERSNGEKGRRIVCVEGDSAFGFSGMEVETMCRWVLSCLSRSNMIFICFPALFSHHVIYFNRYNLPVVIIVVNNNGIYSGVDPETWREMAKMGDLTSMWVWEVWASVAAVCFPFTWPLCHRFLCQSPARDSPTWGALRRGHGSIWRERVSGEDGGGAPQCFGAQFDWLAEAKSPKCPYRPLVWQKTAGNSLAAGVCLWLPKLQ